MQDKLYEIQYEIEYEYEIHLQLDETNQCVVFRIWLTFQLGS